MRKNLVAMAVAMTLAGCGGDDNDNVSGVLLDAAVQGVDYMATPSGTSGQTSAGGNFTCVSGDTIAFKVGGIALGSAACAATITPLELAAATDLRDDKVSNRLLFLQTLDSDDDPDNGIAISAAMRSQLAAASLDFSLPQAAFDTAFGALVGALPATLDDTFGNNFSDRDIGNRRQLAQDHFESTLAGKLGRSDSSESTQTTAGGTVKITKHTLLAEAEQYVPYTGDNSAVSQDFPHGFFPAVGSGLAFKGMAGDGSLEFYGVTDRGPNGDAPTAPTAADPSKTGIAKVFPAPAFTPSIGLIAVGKNGAMLKSLLPIKVDATTKISGRPPAPGSAGASGETPLTEDLKFDTVKAGFDANGLDPESLIYDAAHGVFWLSDEYGPFIVKIDAGSGIILKKYAPGAGAADLPAVLAQRRANRGMEGLTMDSGGKLHGFLQSPIDPLDNAGKSVETVDAGDLDQDGKNTDKVKLKDFSRFNRWIEFDPVTETSKLYAYPLTYPIAGEKWDRNRTGSTKLGDTVALGNGKFLVIEQGTDSTGKVRNFLMLVEIPTGVSDIAGAGIELEKNSIDGTTASTPAWSEVVTLKKTLLLDLNAAGWLAEKAEGLALVDSSTVALINDNDFGLRSVIVDAAGAILPGSIEDCTVDVNGAVVSGCPAGAVGSRVTRGVVSERPTRLWLFKFPQALANYSMP